ncbi:MAG: single-stranded DNA-binding protein [Candidatus Tectomicrobia bacterium]|nr:single-stranded DNA-binding protein [Candidatus Tectomicrobia bacterium]
MANLNHLTLAGHLTRDPELRYTANGTPVATLGLATNHRYRQGTEWKEEVCYIDCTAFGRLAETTTEHLSKGSPILLEGRLRWRSWTGQDGQTRTKHEVLATNVQFLPRSDTAMAPERELVGDLDDLPF